LPDFLKEKGYQEVSDVRDSPFQKGLHTDLPFFTWAQTFPERFRHFNNLMVVQRMGLPSWLDVYPLQEAVTSLRSSEQPLFVDVGGGVGHQCVAFQQAVSDVPNKIILQDVEPVLEHAIVKDGVQIMAHDFFQPQPETTRGKGIIRDLFKAWCTS
jgi:demethylsterigmatocystin 6-O-methyltransferase